MLRDRLVCGIREEGVQKRLLTISDLTFAKILEIAEVAERAEHKEMLQNCMKEYRSALDSCAQPKTFL